ncbi:MAG: histidine kinase, partial [Mesorhizobium sp.]
MNMEDLYRLLRTGHVQAQGIVDTVAYPLLVLDESLCVQSANRSFFETFKVDRDETIGQHIYQLGNGQWDIPDLRLLIMDVIPKSTAVIDYEVEHDFPGLGRRTMLLTARTLFHPSSASHSLLLSIVDATDRYREDAAKDMQFGELRHSMKNLLAVAQSIARHTTTEG